ncbi:MAG: type II CAAX endopeptidase family protein [Bacillota bacterium]
MNNEKSLRFGSFFQAISLFLVLPAILVFNNLLALFLSKIIKINNEMFFITTISIIQGILIILVALYLARHYWHWGLRDFGLGLENLPRGLSGGLKFGPLIFVLVVLSGALIEVIKPFEGEMQPFAQLVIKANSFSELFVLFLLGVFIAPLAEEIYFRGLLFPVIKEYLGLAGGIIVSGLIFGLMHFDLLRFLPLALGGMALAYLYHKTNSLYAAITAHGVWNGIMLFLLHFLQGSPTF